MNTISGFSKMTKEQKISWLSSELSGEASELVSNLSQFWLKDVETQKRFDEFSENTLTNYSLPFGVAPNFLINGKIYTVPMVIEESSVVAAASLSAKFWLDRGGFKTKVLGTKKIGQIHFLSTINDKALSEFFLESKAKLLESVSEITKNMRKRGGGIISLELVNLNEKIKNYYQIKITAETCNAMGANFINSILEMVGQTFKKLVQESSHFSQEERDIEIIMCILSNFTPESLVECYVECAVEDLGEFPDGMSAQDFARRFVTAVEIAKVDAFRAVTHNKGIMNGVDAVILATGNDFRATEACAHAFASRDGLYRSLSSAKIENGIFKFSLKIPLSVGTVGGLTSIHPLAKTSLAILGNPSASELMQIIAATGLAQNFGAIKSLVTTGIQKGHMKLHLLNILTQLNATPEQVERAKEYFSDKVISYNAVRNFLF
jgi:hydroxymethylglutaryl-CoA reductase